MFDQHLFLSTQHPCSYISQTLRVPIFIVSLTRTQFRGTELLNQASYTTLFVAFPLICFMFVILFFFSTFCPYKKATG